jgi:hypothetical protein
MGFIKIFSSHCVSVKYVKNSSLPLGKFRKEMECEDVR